MIIPGSGRLAHALKCVQRMGIAVQQRLVAVQPRSSTFHREALISQRILPEDQGGGCIGFYVGLQTSLDRRCDRPPIRQGRGYHHNGYEFLTSGIKKTRKKTRKRYFALLILVVTNRLYREFRFLHNYIGDVWFWQ